MIIPHRYRFQSQVQQTWRRVSQTLEIGKRTRFLCVLTLALATVCSGIQASAHGQEPVAEQKQSAKVPAGINDRFKDPELNVDEWLQRFEVESREVYGARRAVLEACQIQQGDRIADVGAGTGFYSRLFAKRTGLDGWVYSVDIAPNFLQHIATRATADGIENITTVLGTDVSIRLPPESVDLVFICDTYHHFESPQATLASVYRALKPGGRLVLIDFERIPGKTREFLMGHVRAGKEVFKREIVESGLEFTDEVKIDSFEENYLLRFEKPKNPDGKKYPPGDLGQIVRLGEQLVMETDSHPLTKPFVGNTLQCTSCHLDGGKHPQAAPLWDVATAYPAYSPREEKVITLEDRILNCFIRSQNGKRPPNGGQISTAIATYITWLSEDSEIQMNSEAPLGPHHLAAVNFDYSKANASRGESIYDDRCAACHADDGSGSEDGPPVWGDHSFNDGAGLSKVPKMASWLKVAMPPDETDLSDSEAVDVAAFINSHNRPKFTADPAANEEE